MNERIRELKAQSCFDPDAIQRMGIMPQAEKFAELIVRECITRIEGCATIPDDDEFVKGYNKGVSKVASQVKHHFGVKL